MRKWSGNYDPIHALVVTPVSAVAVVLRASHELDAADGPGHFGVPHALGNAAEVHGEGDGVAGAFHLVKRLVQDLPVAEDGGNPVQRDGADARDGEGNHGNRRAQKRGEGVSVALRLLRRRRRDALFLFEKRRRLRVVRRVRHDACCESEMPYVSSAIGSDM